LSRHYAPAQDNPLKLDKTTSGVLARYRTPGAQAKAGTEELATLIEIRYASPDAARQALAVFRAKVLPKADDKGLLKNENGRWSAVRAAADRVVIVLNAPTDKEALRRISQLLPASNRKEGP